MYQFLMRKVNQKSIKLHSEDLGEPYYDSGDQKPHAERVEILEERYGHLGKLEFIEDGMSEDSEKYGVKSLKASTASDKNHIKYVMDLLNVPEEFAIEEIERWGHKRKKKALTASQKKKLKGIVTKLKQLHAVESFTKDGQLYLKTFLVSDVRNNNGWRASWNSIKKNVKSFIGRPGIEYFKCGIHGCQRDHTDADTFEKNIHVQEKYRVSTIVDVTLDESTHTAYAIHRIDDEEFKGKIERKEVRYLSPSLFPNREKTTMYKADSTDEWYIDTTDWIGVHDAWVDNPAFNHAARIVGECFGGKECITELKSDKMLVARTLLIIAKARQTLK